LRISTFSWSTTINHPTDPTKHIDATFYLKRYLHNILETRLSFAGGVERLEKIYQEYLVHIHTSRKEYLEKVLIIICLK
jgi:hypothetical protein